MYNHSLILLTTMIFNSNATQNKEMPYIIPSDIVAIISSNIHIKDMAHMSRTHISLQMVMKNIIIQGMDDLIQEWGMLGNSIFISTLRARFPEISPDTVRSLSNVQQIPNLLENITKFVEKNANSLNPEIRCKSFIFDDMQNENYGSIPRDKAMHFAGDSVSESHLRIGCGMRRSFIDLILDLEQKSIIAIRTTHTGLVLFKDTNDKQYKVRNNYQNRVSAFALGNLYKEALECYMNEFLSLFFSEVDVVDQDGVIGFFDNRAS